MNGSRVLWLLGITLYSTASAACEFPLQPWISVDIRGTVVIDALVTFDARLFRNMSLLSVDATLLGGNETLLLQHHELHRGVPLPQELVIPRDVIASANMTATFAGLTLRGAAGTNTTMRFCITSLTSCVCIDSGALFIMNGPPASLHVAVQPTGCTVGVQCDSSPVVVINDIAGNIVMYLSDAIVTARLRHAGSTAYRGSALTSFTTIANRGVATFANMTLDVPFHDEGYYFLFSLEVNETMTSSLAVASRETSQDGARRRWWQSECAAAASRCVAPVHMVSGCLENLYNWSSHSCHTRRPVVRTVTTASTTISVMPGRPHHLIALTLPSGAWADCTPFQLQPRIGVADAGGNLLLGRKGHRDVVVLLADDAQATQVVTTSALLTGQRWAVVGETGVAEFDGLGAVAPTYGESPITLVFALNTSDSMSALPLSVDFVVRSSVECELSPTSLRVPPPADDSRHSTNEWACLRDPKNCTSSAALRIELFGHAVATAGELAVVTAPYASGTEMWHVNDGHNSSITELDASKILSTAPRFSPRYGAVYVLARTVVRIAGTVISAGPLAGATTAPTTIVRWQPFGNLHTPRRSTCVYDNIVTFLGVDNVDCDGDRFLGNWTGFGYSVAVAAPASITVMPATNITGYHALLAAAGAFVAVGAPGAAHLGTREVQAIICTCTSNPYSLSGSFMLAFRGAVSDPVSFTADSSALLAALERMPTVTRVRVSRSPALCSGSAPTHTQITFLGPVDEDLPLMTLARRKHGWGTHRGRSPGNDENATCIIRLDDVVRGASGASRTIGAVLIFEPNDDGPVNSSSNLWKHTAILRAPAQHSPIQPLTLNDGFGWSIAASLRGAINTIHTVIIGSPLEAVDKDNDAGAVYVFLRTPIADSHWDCTQRLTAKSHLIGSGPGHHFGWSVALTSQGNTIAVGVPGARHGEGIVIIFKRQPIASAKFFFDQELRPPVGACEVSETPVCSFGYSVSLADVVAVVGAPGAIAASNREAHLEDTDSMHSQHSRTGAGFIYDRVPGGGTMGNTDDGGYWKLRASVTPETAADGDGVGLCVSAADRVVVIGGGILSDAANANGVAGVRGLNSDVPNVPFAAGTLLAGVHVLSFRMLPPASEDRFNERGIAGTFTLFIPSKRLRLTAASDTHRSSRPLQWNVSASDFRDALMDDLDSGRVTVRRHDSGIFGLSHSWSISYDERACVGNIAGICVASEMPNIDVDGSTLRIIGGLPVATAKITATLDVLSEPSPPTRGAVVVVTRDSDDFGAAWIQQALLFPRAFQVADQFAAAVAITSDGSTSFVGAPARDVSSLDGSHVNTGAVFAYDMTFLNAVSAAPRVDPDDPTSLRGVSEGPIGGLTARNAYVDSASRRAYYGTGTLAIADVNVSFNVCSPRCRVPPAGTIGVGAVMTPVSGALRLWATVVSGNNWGIHAALRAAYPRGKAAQYAQTSPATVAILSCPDVAGACNASTSVATSECHFRCVAAGDTRNSARVYDIHATQDVVSFGPAEFVAQAINFTSGFALWTIPVIITDDSIVETPDEVFHVRLTAAGMHPLWGGDLWTALRIVDNNDGNTAAYVAGVPQQRVLQRLVREPLCSDNFPARGGIDYFPTASTAGITAAVNAVAVDVSASFMLQGIPTALGGGAVRIQRILNGLWRPAAILRHDHLPFYAKHQAMAANFGASVAITTQFPNSIFAAVAAPGLLTVSIFAWCGQVAQNDGSNKSIALLITRDAVLRPIDVGHGSAAIALMLDAGGGIVLAVGSPKLEAVIYYFSTPS